MPPQDANPTPSFGGFGIRLHIYDADAGKEVLAFEDGAIHLAVSPDAQLVFNPRLVRLYDAATGESLANFRDSREGSSIGFCLESQAGGVRPPGGLQRLVERHNERLDLTPEAWSKEVIADAVHRSRTAV